VVLLKVSVVNPFLLSNGRSPQTERDTINFFSCKELKGQATKKLDLWTVPDILVIQLKRFSSARDKVTDFVDFPLTGLDLEGRVQGRETLKRLIEAHPDNEAYREALDNDSLLYDLIGVSNHFGGVGGGHYTAFAKNDDNGNWYNFDDVCLFLFFFVCSDGSEEN
jgi:ubiquitin carboxyl-terminal hydrolase 4/11/15